MLPSVAMSPGGGGEEGAVLVLQFLTRTAAGDSGAGCQQRRQADTVPDFGVWEERLPAPFAGSEEIRSSRSGDFHVFTRAMVNHVMPGKCAQACRLLHFPGLQSAACSLVGGAPGREGLHGLPTAPLQ